MPFAQGEDETDRAANKKGQRPPFTPGELEVVPTLVDGREAAPPRHATPPASAHLAQEVLQVAGAGGVGGLVEVPADAVVALQQGGVALRVAAAEVRVLHAEGERPRRLERRLEVQALRVARRQSQQQRRLEQGEDEPGPAAAGRIPRPRHTLLLLLALRCCCAQGRRGRGAEKLRSRGTLSGMTPPPPLPLTRAVRFCRPFFTLRFCASETPGALLRGAPRVRRAGNGSLVGSGDAPPLSAQRVSLHRLKQRRRAVGGQLLPARGGGQATFSSCCHLGRPPLLAEAPQTDPKGAKAPPSPRSGRVNRRWSGARRGSGLPGAEAAAGSPEGTSGAKTTWESCQHLQEKYHLKHPDIKQIASLSKHL
ncbi:uncharacterized protein LOC128339286 [Hemicordylus capensis]|uniref:uncharacterized protein LOC128339286 n=1 Tax=Hemicordylus capensis TaxID=884348 RepID=UPI0023021ACA|nr:uncharacterized protein LOC128339286 [Hemicordylus capensis]